MMNGIVSSKLSLKDSEGNSILLAGGSQLYFNNLYNEDITIQPNTYFLNIPFPQAVSMAQIVAVFSLAMTDLQIAVIYNNQADLFVPPGEGVFLYRAAGLWVSSVLGGLAHITIGA